MDQHERESASSSTADPRPASEPRHRVEVRRDIRIPVRDGLALSANLWLPIPEPDAPARRFPVVLEMIPYRKDDWRWASDEARGQWLAARGFALCRLDIRGTGSSPGIALDEYTAEETLDGYDTVEWLAGRAWCNGNVGMWGISYGGFTAIQVAMLRPPHLRAGLAFRVAPPAARRAVLAARIAGAGLVVADRAHVPDCRLDGRLRRLGHPDARTLRQRPAPGADRQGSTPCPTKPTPARRSTGSMNSCDSSTTGSRGSTTA
jgi:pimeloyl-ACP methyl ester carboxylesterase